MPKDESSGVGAVCVFLIVVFVPSAFKHIVFVNMSQSRDGDVETSEYDIKVDTGNTVADPVATVRDNNSGNKISIVKDCSKEDSLGYDVVKDLTPLAYDVHVKSGGEGAGVESTVE